MRRGTSRGPTRRRRSRDLVLAATVVANDNAWTVWAVAVLLLVQAVVAEPLARKVRTARRLLAELSPADGVRRP